MSSGSLSLREIERCFSGAIPAVLATGSADGVPNVTYISRAHQVDDERVALSNQFMSKTARNLAVNPRASLLLIDPATHDEYHLALVYERTERRGHVFERLRADVDALAVLEGMEHVYRLRAADVFRVVEIRRLPSNPSGRLPSDLPVQRTATPELAALAELAACIGRAGDLDVLVETVLERLDRTFGYGHTVLLLVDETGRRLYTIASRGFDTQSIGAEVAIGDGQIGLAAARCEPLRIGSLRQMEKYSRSIRRQYADAGVGPGREVSLPGVPGVESRIVVPAIARGELVGVLVAESRRRAAFGAADELALRVVAGLVAQAVELMRSLERDDDGEPAPARVPAPVPAPSADGVTDAAADGVPDAVTIRFFEIDGSVFCDGDYLIKGVAGRILWSLVLQHAADGRVDFTNRELRLDPTLDLPGFKDNLESRLILLKRRLDERAAPIRIEKTGRGRFRIVVSLRLVLEAVPG